MGIELWTPKDLFALREDTRMAAIPSYFLDTYFTLSHYSEDGEIRFGDLPEADRFLAPFVLPYEQGKPTQGTRGEKINAITVPYIKLKDAVRPTDVKNIRPSEVFRNAGRKPTIGERFDMRTTEITQRHLRMIDTREAWMAARALIDGKVQINYDRDQGADHPSVLLDFGRDAGHTVVKSANFWDDPATDILGDVEGWMSTMYLANGGGSAAQLIVGAKVAPVFRKNTGIKAALDTNYRGNTSVQMDLGIMRTERPLTRIGQLTNGLEVLTYKDTVDIPNGSGGKTKIDLFNEKDVLLVAPGANGVRCYGAIYDVEAIKNGLENERVFAKMFTTQDPGEQFLMHQSSPLPVPLYPNRTFKARVLA
ncbi:major capsid protein [Mesorhizobium sp. M0859]|uniref:major capsid protein n=1 Tax=Mesorhizobium sp. M0859 TaxID=2957014 RepID=UPI00333C7580